MTVTHDVKTKQILVCPFSTRNIGAGLSAPPGSALLLPKRKHLPFSCLLSIFLKIFTK